MKFLSWLIFVPFALIVVLFAISNRGDLTVSFWPLPFTVDIPLYYLSLGTLAFGFFIGSLLTWLSVAKWRVIAASRKKDTEYAEAEIERLNAKVKKLEPPKDPTPPSIPPLISP